ncbi:STAS domain-containing protein [Blastococcus sp. CT_GayMR20]|nr:STAS domain-containing protein [Blastococcus sp. CT_GayMR20]TFV72159.1 STAS domain-containing protein [Blastococcus sp. CT_GayMR20]
MTTHAPESREPSETMLSEVVDVGTGHIRARGHLTRQGADLLSGTADSLRVSGHTSVVLDLQDVRAADDAGLDILRNLRRRFAAAGGELRIRHAPGGR